MFLHTSRNLKINDINLTNKTNWIDDTNITDIFNNTKENLSDLWNEYSNW